jgi:hypothetical protein
MAREDYGEHWHMPHGYDGDVSFVACDIPYLRLHRLAVDVDGAGRELDTDCGIRLQVELVTSEPRDDLVTLHGRLLVRR